MRAPLALSCLVLAALTPVPAAAQQPGALMERARAMLTADPAGAAKLIEAARAEYVRAGGLAAPDVALADYRLALSRALAGDRAGQIRPMATAAEQLADRASTPQDRTLAAQALIVAASFTMSSGDAALTDRLRDRATALLARDDLARTADLAEAYRVVADVLIYQNQPAEALGWAERSVATYANVAPDDADAIYALARRGSANQRLSRLPEALADFRRAVALADRTSAEDPTRRVYALRALGTHYWRLAEPELAFPLFERALELARQLPPGFPYAGGIARDIMLVLLDSDRLNEARSYAIVTAERTRATMGAGSYEHASALLVLARIDIASGALDDAARRIDAADAIFARALVKDNSRRFEPIAARAGLVRAEGRSLDAAALYRRADDLLGHLPGDDGDRIDLTAASAAALLDGGESAAAWRMARTAADGMTARIERQVAGSGAIDGGRARSERVYATALDAGWQRYSAAGPPVNGRR